MLKWFSLLWVVWGLWWVCPMTPWIVFSWPDQSVKTPCQTVQPKIACQSQALWSHLESQQSVPVPHQLNSTLGTRGLIRKHALATFFSFHQTKNFNQCRESRETCPGAVWSLWGLWDGDMRYAPASSRPWELKPMKPGQANMGNVRNQPWHSAIPLSRQVLHCNAIALVASPSLICTYAVGALGTGAWLHLPSTLAWGIIPHWLWENASLYAWQGQVDVLGKAVLVCDGPRIASPECVILLHHWEQNM